MIGPKLVRSAEGIENGENVKGFSCITWIVSMSEVSFSCFSDSDENGNGPVAQSSSSSAESSSGSETDSEDDSDSDNITAQKKKKSEAKSKPKVTVWFIWARTVNVDPDSAALFTAALALGRRQMMLQSIYQWCDSQQTRS